jgi:hypothetical protein
MDMSTHPVLLLVGHYLFEIHLDLKQLAAIHPVIIFPYLLLHQNRLRLSLQLLQSLRLYRDLLARLEMTFCLSFEALSCV